MKSCCVFVYSETSARYCSAGVFGFSAVVSSFGLALSLSLASSRALSAGQSSRRVITPIKKRFTGDSSKGVCHDSSTPTACQSSSRCPPGNKKQRRSPALPRCRRQLLNNLPLGGGAFLVAAAL